MRQSSFNRVRQAWEVGLCGLSLVCLSVQNVAAPAPAAPPTNGPSAKANGTWPVLSLSSQTITLDQAISRAETSNPQIQALRAAVEVARQRRAAATDIEDPEALGGWGNSGGAFGEPVNSLKNDQEWRAGARVYVPNPFLMSAKAKARSAETMAARADLQAAQWAIECDVRRLFSELGYLEEDLTLATDLARAQAQIMQDVRSRAQQGAATAGDVVASAQKELETQNNADVTRHQRQLAQRDLAGLLAVSPESVRFATNRLTHLSLPQSALPFDQLELVALGCRGDIVAFHWRTLAAQSACREARNERIPWLKEITVGNRQPTDQWWVGVGVTVPVFSWTKNHTADVLQAQSHLAGVNETNGVQLVRRELRNALDEVQERQRIQARNEEQVGPLIAEMRRTVDLLKHTPNLVASQVATTEVQVIEASRLELAARWEYQLALLNLERVVGRPLSEALPRPM